MTPMAVRPEILAQLETLDVAPDRPLIISDADEVLLRFMERMEHWLEARGLWIDLDRYAITGNIRSRETDEVVEIPNILDEFFAVETAHIAPVAGAAHALQKLSERAQILVFSNLPETQKQTRHDNLSGHGMAYPLVVGSGAKGPPVAWLEERMNAPVFFLDDIPHHIDSVAEHAPNVYRIHFVADPRLGRPIGAADGATARIDVWNEAHDWISARLASYGF